MPCQSVPIGRAVKVELLKTVLVSLIVRWLVLVVERSIDLVKVPVRFLGNGRQLVQLRHGCQCLVGSLMADKVSVD